MIPTEGKLLRIFIGEADRWHGRPLYEAIIEEARKRGLAGATAWKGFTRLGAHSRLHTTKILRLSQEGRLCCFAHTPEPQQDIVEG